MTMNHRLLVSLSVTALLVALALVLAACSDDDTVCPVYEVGALEGYVTVLGEPASVEIRAINSDPYFLANTFTDSSGWYHLDLPSGKYRLGLDFGSYSIMGDYSDTVRIAPQVLRHDLPLGKADIQVKLPAEFEGHACSLILKGKSRSENMTSWVQNGRVSFRFPALVPGSYTMNFRAGRSDITFPAAMTSSEQQDSLVVGTGTAAAYDIDFSHSYASLSGRIRGFWQETGTSKPDLEIFSPDSLLLDRVIPADDGSFTLEMMVAREIVLATEVSFLHTWFGGASCEEATHFDLQPGDRITDLEIPLSTIRLTLHGPGDLDDHQASLRIWDGTRRRLQYDPYGQDESLILTNLGPRTYFLQVNGWDTGQTWAAQWYQGAESLDSATPIELEAGVLLDLDMNLVEGGRIRGQVYQYDGTSRSLTYCAIFDESGAPLGNDGYYPLMLEFEDGAFEFTGLNDGVFYVAAYHYWAEELFWYPGTWDFDEAAPITITDHGTVEGIDWALQPVKEVRP